MLTNKSGGVVARACHPDYVGGHRQVGGSGSKVVLTKNARPYLKSKAKKGLAEWSKW
jgi:hypothetical protein